MSHSDIPLKKTLSKDEAASLALEHIHDQSVTDFSVYWNQDGDYLSYAEAGHRWSESEISELIRHGHALLFYHTSDSAKVDGFLKIAALPAIDTSLPPAERIVNMTDVAAELTRMLYDSSVTASAIAKGEEIAKHMVTCIQEDRTCVAALGKLANHDWYTFYHSARVASYALAIAMEMGLTDRLKLEEMAIGCLFHDIGKSKIDLHILHKATPLTTDEWAEMRRHPEYGDALVTLSILSPVPRQIILHHHERLDGGGYPHKLTSREIIQEVRIASFADTFDALTTNRPYQPGRSRYQALDLIRHRFLEQLDKECYKMMVLILQRVSQAS